MASWRPGSASSGRGIRNFSAVEPTIYSTRCLEELPGFQSRPRRPPPEPEPVDDQHSARRRLADRDRQAARPGGAPDIPELVGHPVERAALARPRPAWCPAEHHHPPRQGHVGRRARRVDPRGARTGAAGRHRRPGAQAVPRRRARHAGARARRRSRCRSAAAPRIDAASSSRLPVSTVTPTYEVLSSANGRSVVRCELLTGRTHQIRVHLAALGYPIVGDRVYGEADAALPRQALHAWRLSLPHPVTRETLEFEAPVPHDLRGLIAGLS